MKRKRFLSLLLCAALIFALLPAAPAASDPAEFTFDVSEGNITIQKVGDSVLQVVYGPAPQTTTAPFLETQEITIIGTTTSYGVKVESGVKAKITLSGVDIDRSISGGCAFDMTGATVELTLAGVNNLKSGFANAGLQAPSGAKLTIGGEGELTAIGGSQGAGIGGGELGSGGDITISGGTVAASGGSDGAGIGGGELGSGGEITISGGMVTANGGDWGAGIGGGNNGDGGNITITGGSVKANSGGGLGEAIGRGEGGAVGSLTNSRGENVYLTRVTLVLGETNAAYAPVSSLTASVDYIYGVDDVVTDSDGKLYLYLPAGTETTAAQAADLSPPYTIRTYTGAITTNPSHTAAGELIAPVQLAAPADPEWDGATPGKAMWDAVASASSYTLQLYKNGAAQGSAVTGITDTEYDFTSDIVTAGTGVYTFTVIAVGNGVNYTDSDPSAASDEYIYRKRGDGGGGGSTSSTPPAPDYKAVVKAGNNTETTLLVTIDRDARTVSVDASSLSFDRDGMVITIPSIPDVDTYTVVIPVPEISTSEVRGTLTLDTDVGSVTVPSNMLTGVTGISGSKAEISIGKGDKDNLPAGLKAAIGDRPLIRLTLSIDGNQTNWSNPGAPVTVSIPYTPTAAELANPESIVIWYIDGSGNAVCVPNGRYDPATGTVTFTTTHFSDYAVAYNPVSFSDVPAGAWFAGAVSFIAARDITSGTGTGRFSPGAKLTRGEFIVMLMKAYAIAPDTNPADNFSDAGNTWYTGYLAAAKRHGISAGIGGNLFAPEKEITRQEMFTLLYNALKVIGQLPNGSSGKTLSDFSDAGDIASWARDALTILVETGTIGGSGGKLNPAEVTTRAEMAQVLHNLLGK